jgi:hypothetical protein
MKNFPRWAALALTMSLAMPAAFAAEPAPNADVAAACQDDVKTLCPGVAPGEGRIGACLKEKRKDVSKACKSALAKAKRSSGKPAS